MSTTLTVLSTTPLLRPQVDWMPVVEKPVVGKDVLDLLSSAMYVNPLSIYREYVQNSADSIDEAKRLGVLSSRTSGRVDIAVDHGSRTVRIRDNGIGLPGDAFVERLVAFGASKKRGSYARGFRGVGRLGGIGYCQELIFRSRVESESQVRELRWDCRNLKALLRDHHVTKSLEQIVREIVTTRAVSSRGFPEHFFEVQLVGIVRHGNDVLMDEVAIENYLSQTAPVPFAPEFAAGQEIEAFLSPKVALGNIDIHIDGREHPIYRPHRDTFEVRKRVLDRFGNLQTLILPNSDGDVAAIGWVLHHSYLGALPPVSHMHGLRLRSGNMQIGDAHLLAEIFPEPRFNSWCVGEIHIVDGRITPNGRRDHFEQNIHFHNILNKLAPLARDLARRCRTSSISRNWMKQIEVNFTYIEERADVIRQGAITKRWRRQLQMEIEERFTKLEKIASSPALNTAAQKEYAMRLKRLKLRLAHFGRSHTQHRRVTRLRGSRRLLAQRIFDLIYETWPNQASARTLIERILRKL
jgi:hypothetical protein